MNAQVSLWDVTAPAPVASEPLQHDRAVEVAIVGGGYTGCSTALHLAERGVHCMVLEANKFGYGGSGRNAGLAPRGGTDRRRDLRSCLLQHVGPIGVMSTESDGGVGRVGWVVVGLDIEHAMFEALRSEPLKPRERHRSPQPLAMV